MRRGQKKTMSPFRAGAIAILVVALATYFAFAKHVPFLTHHYQLKAVFQNATNLRTNSPVRIAGVNVGTVTNVKTYKDQNGTATGAALVTMSLNKNALPIHSDATLKIRPKLFLEGNFFVQLQPGSPSGRSLDSGSTIPVTCADRSLARYTMAFATSFGDPMRCSGCRSGSTCTSLRSTGPR